MGLLKKQTCLCFGRLSMYLQHLSNHEIPSFSVYKVRKNLAWDQKCVQEQSNNSYVNMLSFTVLHVFRPAGVQAVKQSVHLSGEFRCSRRPVKLFAWFLLTVKYHGCSCGFTEELKRNFLYCISLWVTSKRQFFFCFLSALECWAPYLNSKFDAHFLKSVWVYMCPRQLWYSTQPWLLLFIL